MLREHLEAGEAGLGDGFEGFVPVGERAVAPQAKALHVGDVVNVGDAGRGGVDDARLGEEPLQQQAGLALARRVLGVKVGFFADGVSHVVGLVEDDEAVEVGGKPALQLLNARVGVVLAFAQQHVGHEQEAVARQQVVERRVGARVDDFADRGAERDERFFDVHRVAVFFGQVDGAPAAFRFAGDIEADFLVVFADAGAVGDEHAKPVSSGNSLSLAVMAMAIASSWACEMTPRSMMSGLRRGRWVTGGVMTEASVVNSMSSAGCGLASGVVARRGV